MAGACQWYDLMPVEPGLVVSQITDDYLMDADLLDSLSEEQKECK